MGSDQDAACEGQALAQMPYKAVEQGGQSETRSRPVSTEDRCARASCTVIEAALPVAVLRLYSMHCDEGRRGIRQGGGPGESGQEAGAQPGYAIFCSRQLKNGNFENRFFFDILTIHNDQMSYVKHVLDPLYVFFALFGCWRGDGGLLNDFVTS